MASLRAFTIVELLVVTAIIVLLLSLVIVAMNAATRTSQKTRTAALIDSMKKGLIRFKEEVGYYPPVLGPGATTLRDLFPPPNPTSATYAIQIQEWWSSCSLADYLVGYGNHREDGFGATGLGSPNDWSDENPPQGIRNPQYDGVWGATTITSAGLYTNRMKMGGAYGTVFNPLPIDQGKILGPYLELKDERLLAAIHYGPNGMHTYFPGDVLPAGQTWETLPKVVVDYWGMPIRYFRRPYPAGALGQSYRAFDRNGDGVINDSDRVPTLSDVHVLRPREIKSGSELTITNLADPAGAPITTTAELQAGEFALLAAGPDKRIYEGPGAAEQITQHEDNVDNIVEVGP